VNFTGSGAALASQMLVLAVKSGQVEAGPTIILPVEHDPHDIFLIQTRYNPILGVPWACGATCLSPGWCRTLWPRLEWPPCDFLEWP
jgi:hypothetical protein